MKRHTFFFGLALVITTTLIFAGCDTLAGEAEASITSFTSDTYNTVVAGNQLTFTVEGSVEDGMVSSTGTDYSVTLKLYVDGKETTVKDIKRTSAGDFIQKMTVQFVESGEKKLTVSVFNAKGTKSPNSKSLTITVTESNTPTGISLNNSSITIKKSESKKLTATITPSSLYYPTVTWKSNDETIATVSPIGYVTGVNKGTTTITASTSNGIKATCQVTVTAADTTPDGSSFDLAYFYTVPSTETAKNITLEGRNELYSYISLISTTTLNFARDKNFPSGITVKIYNDSKKLISTVEIMKDRTIEDYYIQNVPAGKYYLVLSQPYFSNVTGNFYIWKD